MGLLPVDNAILTLKRNGLLTLILTCAASTDLNPVCYAVWRALQEMVYHCTGFKSLDEPKSAILSQRSNNLSQAILDRSIGEWWRRLENVVHVGHIEHVC